MMYGVYYQMVGKEITGVEIDGKHYSESDIKSALSVPVPTLPCAVCGQASSDRTALSVPLPEIEGGDKGEPHSDDLAVDRFAAAMKAKLAEKRAQGYHGWDDPEDCTIEHLSNLLVKHVGKGDPVDVGNFAMMIHQRGERIK